MFKRLVLEAIDRDWDMPCGGRQLSPCSFRSITTDVSIVSTVSSAAVQYSCKCIAFLTASCLAQYSCLAVPDSGHTASL